MCRGDMESFRTILKVSGLFRNVSGKSRESLDDLDLCLYDLESLQTIWKALPMEHIWTMRTSLPKTSPKLWYDVYYMERQALFLKEPSNFSPESVIKEPNQIQEISTRAFAIHFLRLGQTKHSETPFSMWIWHAILEDSRRHRWVSDP